MSAPRSLPLAAVLAVAVAAVAACAPQTRWQHPSLPQEQWEADAAQCKHEARKEAAEQLERDNPAGSMAADSLDEDEIDAMFMQADFEKLSRRLFDKCMRGLGYRAVEAE